MSAIFEARKVLTSVVFTIHMALFLYFRKIAMTIHIGDDVIMTSRDVNMSDVGTFWFDSFFLLIDLSLKSTG